MLHYGEELKISVIQITGVRQDELFLPRENYSADLIFSQAKGAIGTEKTTYRSPFVTPANFSAHGVMIKLGEEVKTTDKLMYTLRRGLDEQGIIAFMQPIVPEQDYVDGDFFEFWFDRPDESFAGTELFSVMEITRDGETRDLIVYALAKDPHEHWVEARLRTFQDDPVVFKTSVENSAVGLYNVFVDAEYTGDVSDGTALQPYKTIQEGLDNSKVSQTIIAKGAFNIISPILLPPRSFQLIGVGNTTIGYQLFDQANTDIFIATNNVNSRQLFQNLTFQNAGGFAFRISNLSLLQIENCRFENNGWDGNRLSTIFAQTSTWATGGTLGYNSTQSDLQLFAASRHVYK